MSKLILFNTQAREKLKAGVDALANAVRVTLGPKGRNVIFEKWNEPVTTKDGVTVAEEVDLEDRIENMGSKYVMQAAKKTNDLAGDGTTTSIVLAQAMVSAGMKNVVAGANPMDLKRGIDKATKVVIEDLVKQSEVIGDDYEKIKQIGSISANNDELIGALIADAMKRVTKDGVITVEVAKGTETYVEEVQGMQFDRGYLSPYFVTDAEKMITEYEDALILIYDKRISNLQEIIPVMEKAIGANMPLLIIAEDFDSEALRVLVVNRVRGQLKIVAVKAPGFGDRRKGMLEDIAVLTGGTVISQEMGYRLESVELEQLGRAGRVRIDRDNTTIVNGAGDKGDIIARSNMIKSQIETVISDYDKEKLQERLAKLSGGVAVLYVGAPTEAEMNEKKYRVEDALNATKAAVAEGVVAGGGVALVRAIKALDGLSGANQDETIGIQIVRKSLEAPCRIIAENAGIEGSVALNKVENGTGAYGYNARTDVYEDLKVAGVIDPTKVTRIALENAASVAGMILMTDCVIVEKPEPNAEKPDPMAAMRGGMR